KLSIRICPTPLRRKKRRRRPSRRSSSAINALGDFTMRLSKLLGISAAALALSSGFAMADSLDNLERERALMIEALLDPSLAPADRQQRLDSEQRRLVDLERMVLRDDALKGKTTPTVRKA